MRGRRTRLSAVLATLALIFGTGCYRTHYVNFSGANPDRTEPGGGTARATAPTRVSGWQSFFVYGWAPGERQIDAVALCRSAHNVESVQTRLKFIQGLIGAFADIYINIYSPWDGAVYCFDAPHLVQTPEAREGVPPVSATSGSGAGACAAACAGLAEPTPTCPARCR